jgi:shikimate kinase
MAIPKRIILIGMKSSGKTTAGRLLARRLRVRFIDMDAEIERLHAEQTGERLPFREIFKRRGGEYFRAAETAALRSLVGSLGDEPFVLSTGGGLPLAEENRELMRGMGTVVFLDVRDDVLLERIVSRGIPAFFPYPDDPRRSLEEILAARRPVYSGLAAIRVECGAEPPDVNAEKVLRQLEAREDEN